jgi:GT2 family glycosyltransferase
LVDAMHEEGRRAAAGPLVTNADGTYQPQCRRGRLTPLTAAFYFSGMARLQSPRRAYIHPETRFDVDDDVEALSGCCMMLRRSAFDAVGGFDESMRLYGEDLDLCYRLRDDGWHLRFEPAARALHHGGKGGTEVRPWHSRFHYHRSMARLFRKHGGVVYPLYGWAVDLALWAHLLGTAAIAPLRRRGVATPKRDGRAVPEAAR